MKEPINRLPGPGFGSGSMQHYPSAKQHRSEQSVFISPHPPDRQSEGKGRSTSVTPKLSVKFMGPCTARQSG